MRLKKLVLTKFKTFAQEQIDFAPITLLTGANSSGKTSVLQALCAITQARDAGTPFPFDLQLNGPLARLGDFQNVINGHSATGSFGLTLEFVDRGEAHEIGGTYRKAEEGGGAVTRAIRLSDRRATAEIVWNQKAQAYFLEYQPKDSSSSSASALELLSGIGPLDWMNAVRTSESEASSSKGRTTDTVFQDAAKKTNINLDELVAFFREQEQELRKGKIKLTASRFEDAMTEVRKLPPVSAAISRAQNRVGRALRQLAYVGAVRALPLRYYAVSSPVLGFDPYGESVSFRLARWKQSARNRFNAVKDALVQLELATELNAETHLGEFVQVRIKPKDRKHTDTIADVGFGVSQVLPMIVADAALSSEGVVLVNQPEVHLHPSSQALLGNYFAQRIESRQYVIETHSEYLITRLRILVARKKLRAEDVNLYFMMPAPDASGTSVRRIEIDESGRLVNPPKEFFKTYITDSYELALSSFPET